MTAARQERRAEAQRVREEVPATEPDAAPEVAPAGWGRRLLARLELQRPDVVALLVLTAVAFVFRFFSPLMPDVLSHPFQGAPISNCVQNTPVDTANHAGTLCGLAYPFQRNYAQAGQPPTPPQGQIFDEVYFPVFAHDDLKGISYFDPEPPLSKLFIASGEWLYGWWRATFEGAHGNYADLGFNTFGWRIMACLFGTLCVPMMYLLAHRLWPNRVFALAAGVLTCFDGMFFVQSRIGMIDIFPIFLILLSYWVFLIHLGSRTERESLVTLVLTGIVLGLAISSKWIALAAWASVIFFLVMRPIRRRLAVGIGEWRWGRGEGPALPGGARIAPFVAVAVVALVLVPVAIYLASWIPFFTRGQFHDLKDLILYQKQSYDYHAHLTATHPYGSPWFSWPFLFRPVAYYYEYQGLGSDAFSGQSLVAGIVNLGNPWIWWTSLPCLLALPYFIFRHRSFPAAVIAVGFITQFLPWSRVTRVIFLYHMFGGLIFMILALAFTLGRISTSEGLVFEAGAFRLALSGRQIAYAHLAVAIGFFLWFYPVWTGLPITGHAYLSPFPDGKMWFPSWI